MREMRADILFAALLAHPETVDDIASLPRVASWEPLILADAIDRLVAEGRIVEDAIGRLVVVQKQAA